MHISDQVYGMDSQIRELVQRLPSGPEASSSSTSGMTSTTLSTIVTEQQNIRDRLAKIERRQQKSKEHEKRKTKFLNKMMDTLRKFCGSGSGDDEDEAGRPDDDILRGPSTSSSG